MSKTKKIAIELVIDPNIIYAIQNNKGLSLGQQLAICNAIKNSKPVTESMKGWIPCRAESEHKK